MYLLCEKVIVIKCREIIRRIRTAAERFTVTDLLDVTKTTCNAFIAVGIESIERERYACLASAVDFALVKNRSHLSVDDLRRRS